MTERTSPSPTQRTAQDRADPAPSPVMDETAKTPDAGPADPAHPVNPRQKRQFVRYGAPLTVVINGTEYQALDWSLGGFRIAGVENLALAGERTTAEVVLRFSEFSFRFSTTAELVRLDPVGRDAAFRFVDLSAEETRALGYVSSAYLSGKLKDVDGLLRHIGRTETSTSDPQAAEKARAAEGRRRWIKRGVFLGLCIVAALSVRAAVLSVTSVESVAAWVDAPVIALSAPEPAAVADIAVAEGDRVDRGDRIADLVNRELRAERNNAVAEARILRTRRGELVRILTERTGVLTAEASAAAKAQANAIEQRNELRQSLDIARDYASVLRRAPIPGATTLEERTDAEQHVVEIASRLAVAEAAVAEATSRQRAAEAGFFFGDARSTGYDPSTLKAEIEAVTAEIRAAETRVDGLDRRLSELTLTSPCDCRVTELVLTEGERALGQQAVVRLTPDDRPAKVMAFVRHGEARRLQEGQSVAVRLADGRRDPDAVIATLSTSVRQVNEVRLLDRDLNPERFSELTIALSPDMKDVPAAAADVTIHWPLIRRLRELFAL